MMNNVSNIKLMHAMNQCIFLLCLSNKNKSRMICLTSVQTKDIYAYPGDLIYLKMKFQCINVQEKRALSNN